MKNIPVILGVIKHRERFYSIAAFGIYLVALQIVFFPFAASRLSVSEFSYIVLVFILSSICSSVFGNELGNLRITANDRYLPLKQLIIRGLIGVSFCLCLLIVVFVKDNKPLSLHFVSSLYIALSIIKFYLLSHPREWKRFDFILLVQFLFFSVLCFSIFLNLKNIFHYLLSLVLSELTVIISLFILIFKYKNESNRRSKKISNKEITSASMYALLQNATLYLDRLMIPLLWPPAVLSYYFAASALSKLPIALSNPIAQVILSEKVGGRVNVNRRRFKPLIILFALLLIATYAITHALTYFLYYEYYPQAKGLILYLSIFSSALFISNLLTPNFQANRRYGVLSLFNIAFIVSFVIAAIIISETSNSIVHLSIFLSFLVVFRTFAYIIFSERENVS